MYKTKIGEHAGIVFRVLHGNGMISWKELLERTKLSPMDLACAIGWLAREDKITISEQNGTFHFEVYHERYY